MTGSEDPIDRALRGEGPIHQAMLAERARELAIPPVADDSGEPGVLVLTLVGAAVRWALPLAAVQRVEPLGACLPLPAQPAAVLGLAMLAGRRCLVTDPDALAAAPRRPASRPGHAVLLRDYPLALAVDRAEAVSRLPHLELGRRLLDDGARLIDADWVVMALRRGGGE